MWNLVENDNNKKIISEIKEGKVYRKFFFNGKLRFEGEYLNGKKMEFLGNIIGIII